ncbi:MAG: PepSY domain-containing protein [Nitrospirota bacterium]
MEPFKSVDKRSVVLARKAHRYAGMAVALCVVILAVTGLALTHQKGWTWLQRVDMPVSLIPTWGTAVMTQKVGQIKALAIHHGADTGGTDLVAATKAGLFGRKSGRWSQFMPAGDQPEVTALLIMDSQWLIGTQQGLFLSDDAGETWTASEEAEGRPMGKITTIQRSPSRPDMLFVGSKTGAYISRDAGRHWTALAGPSGSAADLTTEITVITFDASQREYAFVGTKRGLYRYHQETGTVESVDLEPLERLVAAVPMKMTLDAYLNDLHTGKLFGDRLWPLYDLTAAALVFFVATGMYMWMYPKLRRRRLGFGRESLPLPSSSSRTQQSREPARAVKR